MGLILRSLTSLQLYLSGALIRTLTDTLRTLNVDDTSGDHISKISSKVSSIMTLLGFAALPTLSLSQIQTSNAASSNWLDEVSAQKRRNSLDGSKVMVSSGAPPTLGGILAAQPSQKLGVGFKGRRRNSLFVGRMNILNAIAVTDKVEHIPSFPLLPSQRVGFSILNLTGQSIRYLQQWEGGKKTVQYLNNSERGLLNIVAAQSLIRNGRIVEETFEVQQEHVLTARSKTHKKTVGNRVALQVLGYRWLHAVQADELGVQYEELFPILGRVDATRVYKSDNIARSLQLMVEVLPYCGGRMLRLRSVFSVKNCTKHSLNILARKGSKSGGAHEVYDMETSEVPFTLASEEELYVPIALLYQSLLASQGKSLGLLYLKPADLKPIEEELETLFDVSPGNIEYSVDPVNLFQIISEERKNSLADVSGRGEYEDMRSMQLCCHVNPKQKQRRGRKLGSRLSKGLPATDEGRDGGLLAGHYFTPIKLPPFCYSVEVVRNTQSAEKRKNRFGNLPSPYSRPENFTIGKYK
ncbi:hypothetical protein EON65_18000 [archaeon]|nr:MAG: hypothetical protein EON65_18000 [archaeon]